LNTKAVRSEGTLQHIHEHKELDIKDVRFILRSFPACGRVLDVGAGRGGFVQEACRQGLDALGLEMQPEAAFVWGPIGVHGVIADGLRAPFGAAAFDVVRMKEILEHVHEPLALVREGNRLLRPGAVLIAHVPTPYSQFYPVANFWDDYTHVRPFSRTALTRLFVDAGFAVESIQGYVAGRNPVETVIGKALSRLAPHVYRIIGRKAAKGTA
jgi:SAM-dependent methyltransferase